jgi:predicted phage-related endonuclease
MSNIDLAKKIDELHELEELIEEAKANAEAVKDSIKAELLMRNTEELEVNGKIIRWTSVLSNRFDTTAFKKSYGELYKQFVKQVSSRRFSIA